MYINDLPNITNKCNFTLFADDATLTFKSHNLYDLEYEINSTLVLICDWLCGNKLVLVIIVYCSNYNGIDLDAKNG